MKMIKCGNDKCPEMKLYYSDDEEDWVCRKHQMVQVPDDFDERIEKSFCSFTCGCYAGYMTLNKQSFEKKGGIAVDGNWWLKDPSGGKDERFKRLWTLQEEKRHTDNSKG